MSTRALAVERGPSAHDAQPTRSEARVGEGSNGRERPGELKTEYSFQSRRVSFSMQNQNLQSTPSERRSVAASVRGSSSSFGRSDDTELTMGRLPSDRLKFGVVFKLCHDGWQARLLILTQNDVIIALPGTDEIADKIPLHEIRIVTKMVQDDDSALSGSSADLAFNVHTVPDGYNCGRDYCFSVQSEEEFQSWVDTLGTMSKAAAVRVANRTLLQSNRLYVRRITSSVYWQRLNGLLIAANLVVNIAQSQVVPMPDTNTMAVFDGLDVAFTSAFAAELAINLFAYWFWPFFTDGWLVFDFSVVTISVASLVLKNLPGVSILRLMRTFRVLRLFNKLKSLRTIINALTASLFPVFNAFLLVILICIVYAILGVELFSDISPDRFGTFLLSYWTLFEISTLDGWTDKARELSGPDAKQIDPGVACFFCTFIGAVCWILIPVVVAILLDNFVNAVIFERKKAVEQEEETRMKALGLSKADIGNPLDPLLHRISRFRNMDDLSRRIGTLFRVLDNELSGSLGFREMHQGLRKMDHLQPRIYLSSDDFLRMTRNGTLIGRSGQLDLDGFEEVMHSEVAGYIADKLADAYEEFVAGGECGEMAAILGALKLLLVRTDPAASPPYRNKGAGGFEPADCGAPGGDPATAREIRHLLSELHNVWAELRDARSDIRQINAGLQAKMQEARQEMQEAVLDLKKTLECRLPAIEARHTKELEKASADLQAGEDKGSVGRRMHVDTAKVLNVTDLYPAARRPLSDDPAAFTGIQGGCKSLVSEIQGASNDIAIDRLLVEPIPYDGTDSVGRDKPSISKPVVANVQPLRLIGHNATSKSDCDSPVHSPRTKDAPMSLGVPIIRAADFCSDKSEPDQAKLKNASLDFPSEASPRWVVQPIPVEPPTGAADSSGRLHRHPSDRRARAPDFAVSGANPPETTGCDKSAEMSSNSGSDEAEGACSPGNSSQQVASRRLIKNRRVAGALRSPAVAAALSRVDSQKRASNGVSWLSDGVLAVSTPRRRQVGVTDGSLARVDNGVESFLPEEGQSSTSRAGAPAHSRGTKERIGSRSLIGLDDEERGLRLQIAGVAERGDKGSAAMFRGNTTGPRKSSNGVQRTSQRWSQSAPLSPIPDTSGHSDEDSAPVEQGQQRESSRRSQAVIIGGSFPSPRGLGLPMSPSRTAMGRGSSNNDSAKRRPSWGQLLAGRDETSRGSARLTSELMLQHSGRRVSGAATYV